MKTLKIISISIFAALSMALAYEFEALAFLSFIFAYLLIKNIMGVTIRQSFWLGFLTGMILYGIELRFFYKIFNAPALVLWSVLAFWLGLFCSLSTFMYKKFERKGLFLMPFIWMAIEYTRSELYVLKFAWVTPGFSFSGDSYRYLTYCGVYFASFLVFLAMASLHYFQRKGEVICAITTLLILMSLIIDSSNKKEGPIVAAYQVEFPNSSNLLKKLDKFAETNTFDIMVLSEYTFDDAIPQTYKDWCIKHNCFLIAGGKDITKDNYYNTVFVISPEGKEVFKQAKMTPIQFFKDGLPGKNQSLWKSPWGKIGIAICYDLSYSKVMDELVKQGAQGLIIPTMDVEEWGENEHLIHSKIPKLRAAEYNLPILRVASSGISQNIDRNGFVKQQTSFPGQYESFIGHFEMKGPSSIPIGRYLCWVSMLLTIISLVIALIKKAAPQSEPATPTT